ncbi:bacillithiol biosynthesis deacetylase BshB1 [Desulforamulus putei DSM 12395]|uniref:Bacillithiol biosynthesis deacetylase BshB1 n=2 Tax=Desulforamulus putei TaxID=74701 RepID=A0A1M4YR45_9FIRM|nr:bacillithiol biosynthesis deacetylase BshB1 [Desulforamulus putei DSM 12395]
MAIGAHPDDVEVGAGGLVAKLIKSGLRVGIVDLTAGELATNGTAEERREEARRAGEVLGLTWRQCLAIPDRGITTGKEYLMRLVEVIRKSRPGLILCPYWEDRHPDHVNASRLVQEAWFDSGLTRVGSRLPPFRAGQIWYYYISGAVEPKFIVDVSECYHTKRLAILAHQTQFGKSPNSTETFLNAGPGSLLSVVESRDRYFGSLIGCMYGEGFTTKSPLAIHNPLALLGVKE